MKIYEYVHRDSLIHRLDPRSKLVWLVVFSALVFMIPDTQSTVLLLILTMLVALAAKLPKKQLWSNTKIFVVLMPVGYILLYFLLLGITMGAFVGGLVFSAKFLVLIFSAVIFTMTTSARDLLLALTKLRVPYSFAFMLTIAIRFIPVISNEINNVINAQRARAYEINFSFIHPVKSVQNFIPIIIPVLMLLLKRSHELSLSIDSRAFRANKKMTYPKKLRFGLEDCLFLFSVAVVSGIMLV
ncbi:MAG: energy-coupling factor transporter transmembrane protein EcfT [Candidatus Aenigmarchaeota archaeon]|nr:energy-coupling factor transporter transmembrane protein EcfT [Candidatus Aenigmarchaeota archaeon]